jgi:hypothetical protein
MYCERCERDFPNSYAIAQHLDNSSNHHRCSVCAFDGLSWEDLLRHHRSTKHRAVCQGCDNSDGLIWDPESKDYLDHLDDDNVCSACEDHFDSPSNLEHVGWLSSCSANMLMMGQAQSYPPEPQRRVLWMLPEIQDLSVHDPASRKWRMRVRDHFPRSIHDRISMLPVAQMCR